ncbi:MAG: hypothetical protein AAF745_14105 [Planctomycetota bacterium]
MTPLIASLIFAAVTGCGSDETPKTSLFEHDHNVAPHWPSSLADLAKKLRHRAIDHDDIRHVHGRNEIEDLVEWVGEIAADTNMSEADWIPLYEKSEAVSAMLRSTKGELSEKLVNEIELLCQLIDETIPKIPKYRAVGV